MESTIRDHLASIEKRHNISIVYACEMGSRAWGLENEESDYDIRFLYVHKNIKWYLSTRKQSDTIDEMIDGGKLDFSGWDMKKALSEFQRSNPSLIEFMQSSHVYINLYKTQERFITLISKLHDNRSLMYHYNRMIQSNLKSFFDGKEMVVLKKYFHIIRPTLNILNLMDKNECTFSFDMDTLLSDVTIPVIVKNKILELIRIKRTDPKGSKERIDKIPEIDDWVRSVSEGFTVSFTKKYKAAHNVPKKSALPKFYEKSLVHYKSMKRIRMESKGHASKMYFLTFMKDIMVTVALYENSGATQKSLEQKKVKDLMAICTVDNFPQWIRDGITEFLDSGKDSHVITDDLIDWYLGMIEKIKPFVSEIRDQTRNFREIVKKNLYEGTLKKIEQDEIDSLLMAYVYHSQDRFIDSIEDKRNFSEDENYFPEY